MPKREARILLVLEGRTPSHRIIAGYASSRTRFIVSRWNSLDTRIQRPAGCVGAVYEVGGHGEATVGRLQQLRAIMGGRPLLPIARNRRSTAISRGGDRDTLPAPVAVEVIEALLRREARIAALQKKSFGHALRTKRQEAMLEALAAVVRATGKELEPRRIVELAMGQVCRILRFQSWIFLLLDQDQGLLRVTCAAGPGAEDFVGTRLGLGEGLSGRAAQRRRVVMATGRGGLRPLPAQRAIRGLSRGSTMAVPLLSRGRVIGVIEIIDGPSWPDRGAEPPEMISFLLEPAAVALDNALLLRRSEELSITDDLTKLYNASFLNSTLRREVERSRRYRQSVSLIFLDLDGFKEVNDQHGHISGSRTLVEVGAVIRETVREVDVVSRFGGDEFTVILPQTGPQGAAIIAERIRCRISESEFLQSYGLKVRLSASFGIASYPDHGGTKDDLIAQADQAMYRVKSRGKNGVEVADQDRPGSALASSAG